MGIVVMSAADKQDEFVAGASIGKYQLVSRLSQNASGMVYSASHDALGQTVAINVVASHLLQSSESRQRFIQEARRYTTLGHRHLVQPLEVDHDGDRVYVTSELHDGNDLAEIILSDGAIPSELVYTILRQATSALRFVHDNGLLHRAVVPQNLLLTPDGDVKVLDLGCAGLRKNHEQPNADTIAYIAPEQIRDAQQADQRSDLYALGCTAYFLLTGNSPYAAMTWTELLNSKLSDRDAPSLAWDQVPADWQSVLKRATAWDIGERFASMREFVQELDTAFGDGVTEEDTDREVVTDTVGCLQCASESSNKLHGVELRTDVATKPKRSLRNWLARNVRQLFPSR